MFDLGAAWTVLHTEVSGDADSIRVAPSGVDVPAGPVNVGVDALGHRHLVIPLGPGEAAIEDRAGRGVQLWGVDISGRPSVSLVCLVPSLNDVYERLAVEVLRELDGAASPARRAADVLSAWKELLAEAQARTMLSDQQLVGLIAELLCLEEVVTRDPQRRVDGWVGPTGHQHDFVFGDDALEVKATTVREGRHVTVHGVEQLELGSSTSLHLAYHRLEAAPQGETLPAVIGRLKDAGVSATDLHQRLGHLGYTPAHDEEYSRRPFRLIERRLYDTMQSAFPKIVGTSFVSGEPPPGTLQLTYTIDLANEPPAPLDDDAVTALWQKLADAP